MADDRTRGVHLSDKQLVFVVMAVVLVVRPHGLLGRPQAEAPGKALSHPPFVPLGARAKALWLAAFAVWGVRNSVIYLTPRIDGRPG